MRSEKGARLPVAVGAFVTLGMPVAAFSVAWPDVARELGRTIGDLGTVLLVHAAGFGFVATFTGRLVARFGVAMLVSVAAVVSGAALVGVAAASSYGLLLVAMAVLGASGGAFDAGLNTYAALEMDVRALNFIHSGFGLGAAVGPWLMTVAVVTTGWRIGSLVLAVLTVTPGLAFWLTRPMWRVEASEEGARRNRPPRADPRVLALILAVFILYTGVEVGAGSWAFSLLSEGRGIDKGPAGFAVGAFWAALTLSRVIMGVVGDRWGTRRVVVVCSGATLLALALMWWAVAPWVGIAGLVVTGLSLGPLFPLHTSLTASRVGRRATESVIGFQLAAAVSGGAIIPWAMGRAVDWSSLEVIGPLLVAGAVGMIGADLALERLVRRRPRPTS